MLPSLRRLNDQPPASIRAYWNLSVFGRFFLALLIIFNRVYSTRVGRGVTVHHLTCGALARILDTPHTHTHPPTHTHTHTPHARTHAFLPWLMGHWHKLPIQCPPPHYHPPIVVFAIKKESTGQKKNLPRKKIARYKGRNSPRERTMITTGWDWGWITLGNETDVFRSQSMAWMVILPYCGGNFAFFFRVMFASVRYVPWTVTNSLPLHTRCIPEVNPVRNYH